MQYAELPQAFFASLLNTNVGPLNFNKLILMARVTFPSRARSFSLLHVVRTGSEFQAAIQWVPTALSSGIKKMGRGADYSPLSSDKVKKQWRCN
jgi:hypothetical protein